VYSRPSRSWSPSFSRPAMQSGLWSRCARSPWWRWGPPGDARALHAPRCCCTPSRRGVLGVSSRARASMTALFLSVFSLMLCARCIGSERRIVGVRCDAQCDVNGPGVLLFRGAVSALAGFASCFRNLLSCVLFLRCRATPLAVATARGSCPTVRLQRVRCSLVCAHHRRLPMRICVCSSFPAVLRGLCGWASVVVAGDCRQSPSRTPL
jgi:hypothetical protein